MTHPAGTAEAHGHVPYRTCVGCRQRAPRSQLLRLVCDTSERVPRVLPDVAGRLPGRGAWIHVSRECMESAIRRRAFARAFTTSGAFDISELQARIDTAAHLGPSDLDDPRITNIESGFDADEQAMSTQR